VHVDGMVGTGSSDGAGGAAEAGSGSDQVMNSALKFKLQAPLVDALLDAAGISGTNPQSLLHP